MKLLIIRFSSIGDIVLTTPVIRCLHKQYPEAEIHYATKESFYPVVQHNPYLHRIHQLDDSLSALIHTLKKERFDAVIDLHHNQRTFLMKQCLRRPSVSFDKINWQKWLMVQFKINRLPEIHIVDRYLDTCRHLQVVNDGQGLDYFIGDTERVDVSSFFPKPEQGFIAWVIGAKFKTKQFPAEKIIRVIDQLHCPVLLLGGKEDQSKAAQILRTCKNKSAVYNACGRFSLNQSASLVQQSRLVVTNDTGLMHIAAAFKKPIVSLWGNTIPEFGMYPYYGNQAVPNEVVEIKNLDCRPCSKLGFEECPKGHFNCMNQIDEKLLAATIQKMWASA